MYRIFQEEIFHSLNVENRRKTASCLIVCDGKEFGLTVEKSESELRHFHKKSGNFFPYVKYEKEKKKSFFRFFVNRVFGLDSP